MNMLRSLAVLMALLMLGGQIARAAPPTPSPVSVLGGYATLSVSSSSSRVALPSSTPSLNAVTIYNTGTVDAFFALGGSSVTATTSSTKISAGQSLTVYASGAYVAGITATSTTSFSIYQSNGPVYLSGAGGSGGGGGGGTVTQGPAGTAPWFVGGQYNATPPTLSDGGYSGLQLDTNGNLNVNIKAGAGSGGTALADEGAFTQGTTNFTPMGGYYNSSPVDLTSGQGGAAVMTAHRALTIDVLPNSTMYSLMSSGAATVGATFPSSAIGIGGKDGSGNIQPPIMSNYGTAPGASPAFGVNAYVTNTPTVQGGAASGASVFGNPVQLGGRAASSNPTAVTNGQAAYQQFDLTGKVVTSPYAIRESQLRCAVSITGTGATTCTGMASQGAGIKIYITDLCIFRSDAGTTAVVATTNAKDSTGTNNTTFVLPNNGGGGGACHTYNTPLVVAAATDFQITMGSSISTIYASATGFSGY